VPHFSRLLREVGLSDACSPVFDVDVAVARVERTLLSVAFDLDFDFDRTLITRGVPHFSRLLREVGITDAFSPVFDVDVAVARVERTLLSVAFDVDLDFDVDTDLA